MKSKKKPRRARKRAGDVLTEMEEKFVLFYRPQRGTEAAIKAGFPEKSAAAIASNLLKKDRVFTAIMRKQEAGLKRMEAYQESVVDAALAHNFTPSRIFSQIDKILKSKRHAKRGWADHNAAMKLGADILSLTGKLKLPNLPPGSEGELVAGNVDGVRAMFYRAKWRDKSDGNDIAGDTTIGAPALPAGHSS